MTVTTDEFDAVIMILIIANVLVMSMTHADMSDEWTSTLFLLNTGSRPSSSSRRS